MILGEVCTRDCKFCAVSAGLPSPVDCEEPIRVATAVKEMGLRHVVLTSVTRDDLPDGGATMFADTIRAVKRTVPEVNVEVLTPDFAGLPSAVEAVLDARPDVFSHNLETVKRLQPVIRPQASYETSLHVLGYAAEHPDGTLIKSAIMLGLGETDEELYDAMDDLLCAGCQVLALGQYLAPTKNHLPVERYVTPSEFDQYADEAWRRGFKAVAASPLTRSSYLAEEVFRESTSR
jgi:lipoic acid synthetase